jgi:hypothetical protein
MQIRRKLRKFTIPAFERFRETLMEETLSAMERWSEFNPNADLDSFNCATGDMYSDILEIKERALKLFQGAFEAIEARVRQLTGKSVDELDAEELDFWAECNTAG